MTSMIGSMNLPNFTFTNDDPPYPVSIDCTCLSTGDCPFHPDNIPLIERVDESDPAWQPNSGFDQVPSPTPLFNQPLPNQHAGYVYNQQAQGTVPTQQFASMHLDHEQPLDLSRNILGTYTVGERTASQFSNNDQGQHGQSFPTFTEQNGTFPGPAPGIGPWTDPGPHMQPTRRSRTFAEVAALNTQQPLPGVFNPGMLSSPQEQFGYQPPEPNAPPSEPVRKKVANAISISFRREYRESRNATNGSTRRRDRSPSILSSASRRSNVSKRGTYRKVSAALLAVPGKEAELRCSICDVDFESRGSLTHHEQNHLQNGDRPFQCSFCDQGFLWKKDLSRHMPKHTREKRFTCALCRDKFFTRNDNLRRHYKNEHPGSLCPSTAGSRTATTANSSQS